MGCIGFPTASLPPGLPAPKSNFLSVGTEVHFQWQRELKPEGFFLALNEYV